MEKIEIYSNKTKATFLLIISLVFSFSTIFLFENINLNKGIFHKFLTILGFILFFSGIILAVKLLLRKEPLLIITSEEILINQVLMKPIKINFKDIKSFEVVSIYNRGFRTNTQIYIEMKEPTEKYKNSMQYKFLFWISSPRIANSQYGIQTTFLDINYKELLKILNKKLSSQPQP
jgi:hypothetical protein